ncbi:hypothetical protein [Marinicauda sp. Alg238-R41]|uniref:hypothetical protein n=1 Tax=Marinicauda sp. Alg238-R41 TaxID=2993447 RepID=UPI0022E73613|nr:hypothetical protein [Marinicauda sp. Alg238-R41]
MVLSVGLLTSYYSAQASMRLAGSNPQPSGASTGTPQGANARSNEIIPPWDPTGGVTALESLRRSVLADGNFFDPKFGEFADMETGEDEKTLFAMHQGLRRLQSLSSAALDKTTTDAERSFWNRRFQEGMEQLSGFFEDTDLTGVSVVKGEQLSKAESTLAISRGESSYKTGILHSGAFDAEVDAFTGAMAFDITVRKNGVDTVINIDLADMGGTARSLDNVAAHINTKLEAEGVLTRFERTKIGEKNDIGVIEGNNFGFTIKGILTEKVSFTPSTGTPAVYVAGLSGTGETAGGQLTKLVNLAGGGDQAFIRRIESDATVTETTDDDGETTTSTTSNPLVVSATARSEDGGIYVVGHTSHAVDGQALKGEQDLVLMRYDSTGKKLWSRVLGAADSAGGSAVAVDSSGNVIVAGSVSGELSGTNRVGGKDSLVVKYSAEGVEQWARRFGGREDDEARSVTLGADGTVYVGGRTDAAFGGVASTGGTDGYLRALDENGNTLYTRGVGGGAGTQEVRATAMASDGGLIVATQEEGRAVLTKYAAGDDGTGAPVWTLDLGDMDSGRIGGLAVDADGAIYLSGAAGSGFNPGNVVSANQGGRDAVLVRISDGPAASVDYTTFLGAAGDNSASGVAAANGKIYLTGKTSDALPGATQSGDRNTFAAGLDAATGALDWVHQVSGRGGLSEGAGIVVDPQGDNALSRMGLPSGELKYSDSRLVTDRSAVRAGDSFFVSVDGGRKKKITIEANETMRSLTFKLNSVMLLDGRADVRRSSAGDILRVQPNVGVAVEFFAGEKGADALSGLGLPLGVVEGKKSALDKDEDTTSDAPKVFALELPNALSIDNKDAATVANDALTAALAKVQRAYRELTMDPALKDLMAGPKAGNRGGTVPAYLQAQIANYSAGLERMNAGGGGGGTLALF